MALAVALLKVKEEKMKSANNFKWGIIFLVIFAMIASIALMLSVVTFKVARERQIEYANTSVEHNVEAGKKDEVGYVEIYWVAVAFLVISILIYIGTLMMARKIKLSLNITSDDITFRS